MNRLNYFFGYFIGLMFAANHVAGAEREHIYHEMQHGFILSDNDKSGSHLVAKGHHSRQVTIAGNLIVPNQEEYIFYLNRKTENATTRKTYFLFQAQNLDLPSLQSGQLLTGHIIESKIGNYEPKNVIVKNATFLVTDVPINVINPFFIIDNTSNTSDRRYKMLHTTEPVYKSMSVVKCHGDDRDCSHPSCAMFCNNTNNVKPKEPNGVPRWCK